jgi:protein ImuB
LALWLPSLPTDRFAIDRAKKAPHADAPPEAGTVLVERTQNALRLFAVDAPAAAQGLAPGMSLADARARAPDLLAAPADPAGDARLLERLAAFCDRFTPWVALDPPDALILDVTGCAHLFGGEAALRETVLETLRRRGFAARVVIASGADAALALVRFSSAEIVAPAAEEAAVRALPVRALRCAPTALTGLARAGLARIEDLAIRPPQAFAARFGPDFVAGLDAVLGRRDAPRAPVRAAPAHAVDRLFAEPLGHMAGIAAALDDLAGALAADLEAAGAGGRAFEASFFRADGAVRRIRVETGRAVRDARAIAALFREKMDALADPLDPGFGYDSLRLAAAIADPLAARQIDLAGRAGEAGEIGDLADRLTARFGADRVLRFAARDAHDPVRAAAWRAAAAGAPAKEQAWTRADPGEPPLRPLHLFDPPHPIEALAEVPDGPPLRFRWRRRAHDVALSEGPERIAPDWRRAEPDAPARDYYRVEDREGRRFWLFREGEYGGPAPPRWFICGLFA